MRGLKRRISRARRSADSIREPCSGWRVSCKVLGGEGQGGKTCLDVADPTEVHDGAAEGAEGVLYVKGKADALAEEELASEDLLWVFTTKVLHEAVGVSFCHALCSSNGETYSLIRGNAPSALHPKNSATMSI